MNLNLFWYERHIPWCTEQSQCGRTLYYHIILTGSPLTLTLAVLNHVCFSGMGYKRDRKQPLPLCCFCTKQGANKQINNHNGTPLTAKLYNGKIEMAACVIALPASHNIHTTTGEHYCHYYCCCKV